MDTLLVYRVSHTDLSYYARFVLSILFSIFYAELYLAPSAKVAQAVPSQSQAPQPLISTLSATHSQLTL